MLNKLLAAYATFAASTGTWLMMSKDLPTAWQVAGAVLNGTGLAAAGVAGVKPGPSKEGTP